MLRYLILVFLAFSLSVQAVDRPTIGLVLSGGGARGGAHLGVIKLLEEKQIPVDYIVGTSMGAFIGGFYATGMRSSEIQTMLETEAWDKYIAISDPREEIPFRRKTLDQNFPGRLKLGVNGNNEVVLAPGLFKQQMMLQFINRQLQPVIHLRDFNKLPIPFISVATDIANGEPVILDKGILTHSIYASIAIPGGFEPVTIDGKILIDGGIAQNLPLQVMREKFDPDFVIVVDISTPFDPDASFASYNEVLGQLSNILMRKNVEDTIKNMTNNEVLITPDLTGYTPLDADKYKEIIEIGYQQASADYESKLSSFSSGDKAYQTYKSQYRVSPKAIMPIIDKIEIHNKTYLLDEAIRNRIRQKIGAVLNYPELEEDLMNIYYMMSFSTVEYRLVREDDQTILQILADPSWNERGQIRFGLGFEDDFNGHSDYQVRVEYSMFGLNAYGGEWRTHFEIGRKRLLFTEWYQPLDVMQRTYFRSDIYNQKEKIYISPSIINDHSISVDNDDANLPINSLSYGARMGFGLNILKSWQIEVGLHAKIVKPSIDLLISNPDGSLAYETFNNEQQLVQSYVVLKVDSFDDSHFPTKGYKGKLTYDQNVRTLGSDLEYLQLFGQIVGAYSWGDHTFMPVIRFGTSQNVDDFDNTQDLAAYYRLGGLFSISGRSAYSTAGDQLAFASGNYRYRVSGNKFLGAMSTQLYVGFSLEAGETWYSSQGSFEQDDIIYGSSVYLAADTIIGPLFLAYGYSDRDHQTVYLSLGKRY